MFSFLIGWGVFWFLIWVVVFLAGMIASEDNWIGTGMFMGLVSLCYLIAVMVGNAAM